MSTRQPYPSDVTDDEWAFVAPYLSLMSEQALQRKHDLREVYNGLRWLVRTGAQWRMLPHDFPRWEAVCQQTQRWLRAQVAELAALVQEVTGQTVDLAYVDQGYTGDEPAAAAAAQGIQLEVIKLPGAEGPKQGFVLLPRRWVVERSFAWLARFRRLARDYERLPATVAGLTFLAFACLMLHQLIHLP